MSISHGHWGAVHPHACGDNLAIFGRPGGYSGSPPRVWGQRQQHPRARQQCTVHPHACGDNSEGMASGRAVAVHPHACGDNAITVSCGTRLSGSPPRVWGQRGGGKDDEPSARFTPTRVGTTGTQYGPPEGLTGSPPRVWGQLPSGQRAQRRPSGSPPRVWGQLNVVRLLITA